MKTICQLDAHLCHQTVTENAIFLAVRISILVFEPQVWTRDRVDLRQSGHATEWTRDRVGMRQSGHVTEWTRDRVDTRQNGHATEWTRDRVDT